MSKRILIADDEPHIARILAMTLKRHGYQVSSVSNGQKALESILESAPDLLISDIEMPRMDGCELLGKLAEMLPDRQFPIIIMTSRTNLEYRAWSDQHQQVHFLEKPVSARKLVRQLDDMLGVTVS